MKFLILFFLLYLCTTKTQAQTWADDVACIFYSHCTQCHNANGIAPFSLTNYSAAVTWAGSIKNAVNQGSMPPWPPDQQYNKLAHARLLSDDEKNRIIQWVNNNTPQGNMANAPTPPVYNSSAEITNPDISAQMTAYTLPSLTVDLYRSFIVTAPVSGSNNFISGFEVIPGNRNIVHHVLVFQDTSSVPLALDNADPGPGYISYGGIGSNTASLIGAWVPGSSATFYPNNMGVKLLPNARIILQIHYPVDASLQSDSTKVNIQFNNAATREIFVEPILNPVNMLNGPLSIPANTLKTFTQRYTVPVNATIIGISPHAHLLCESMKSYFVTAANDTSELINIPQWDFHWQGSYFFPKALKIPALSKLFGEATYNNTTNNPHNPNNPPQLVTWGEATTDEMMLFYFSYLQYQNGDENIIIDTSSHNAHYLNCSAQSPMALNENQNNFHISIYPNPATSILHIESNTTFEQLDILDPYGKIAYSKTGKVEALHSIEQLLAGTYFVRLKKGQQIFYKSFIKLP